jgi:hypothetical protein
MKTPCFFFRVCDTQGNALLELRGNYLGYPYVWPGDVISLDGLTDGDPEEHENFDEMLLLMAARAFKGIALVKAINRVDFIAKLSNLEFDGKQITAWVFQIVHAQMITPVHLRVSFGFDRSLYPPDVFVQFIEANHPHKIKIDTSLLSVA